MKAHEFPMSCLNDNSLDQFAAVHCVIKVKGRTGILKFLHHSALTHGQDNDVKNVGGYENEHDIGYCEFKVKITIALSKFSQA